MFDEKKVRERERERIDVYYLKLNFICAIVSVQCWFEILIKFTL